MSQMAADVFAAMTLDTLGDVPHAEPEGDAVNPHVDVERELLGPPPEPRVPSTSELAQAWAREHTGQALLVTTVGVGWIARAVRRGRQRRQTS